MNRVELSWALSAVLSHAGKYPQPSFVGIEQRDEWVYVYATDSYTLGIARIPSAPITTPGEDPHHLLSVKEATDLERWIRPSRVADKTQDVAYATTDDELHVAYGDESGVFAAKLSDVSLDYMLGLVAIATERTTEWEPVALNPAYLSRFGKAVRDGEPLRLEPKHGQKGASWLATVGTDFVGLAMSLAYTHTPATDLASWPIPPRRKAA